MFVVTLVGTPTLSSADAALAREICGGGEVTWLSPDAALDLEVESEPKAASLESALPHCDVFIQRRADRQRSLFIADMDSTMIEVECIDELADFAGIKPQIAAITEAAMRGELDFEAALRKRVALLEGLTRADVESCLEQRVTLTAGASTLIATLKDRGIRTVLVSGGFTAFAEPVGARLGFDRVVANRLHFDGDRLTGALDGPIVDSTTKLEVLRQEVAALGLEQENCVAIGDGANDAHMVTAAGLGLAYHAKPALAEIADARIRNADLTAVLYALGIPPADWVRAEQA